MGNVESHPNPSMKQFANRWIWFGASDREELVSENGFLQGNEVIPIAPPH
jgi:hypothetical protein